MKLGKVEGELYEKYHSLIFTTVYSKVRDVQHSEELTHDIFMLLFQKIESVSNTRAWLLGTIKKTLSNYFKINKIDTIDIDYFSKELTFINGFKDTRIILEECANEALSDDTDYLIYNMIAVKGLSYNITAKSLNQKEHIVKYRYKKIISMIRDALLKKGIKSFEDLL